MNKRLLGLQVVKAPNDLGYKTCLVYLKKIRKININILLFTKLFENNK